MPDATPPSPWKLRIARLLGAAGIVLLTLTLLMLYVGRIVLRDDTFADRVVSSLQDPRVGEFIGLRITDVLIEQKPDLTALRPILVVVTRGVVTSAPFRALVRPAASKLHAALLSPTTGNILLAVPDAQVLVHEALKTTGAASGGLPDRLKQLMELEGSAPALQAIGAGLRAAQSARFLARVGLIVAVLCFAGAIVLSPARRASMLVIGVGVATVGLVVGLVVPAGRLLLGAAIVDTAAGGAAVGLWDAFFGPLRLVGIVVALIGVVIALVGVPGEMADAVTLRNRLWDFVSRVRERPLAEAGRLTVIGLTGLLGALFPGMALSFAAVAGGALLVLFSLVGVRHLVQPYLPQRAQAASAEAVRVAPIALVGVRVILFLALGVGAAAALLAIRRPVVAEAAVRTDACNGAVELCNHSLNQVVFPGAHNAMGTATNPDWLFPNQDIDIKTQLERGVRAFLLDPYRGNRIGDRVKTDVEAVPHVNRKVAAVIGTEAFAAGMRIRDRLQGEPGPSNLYFCHGFCELGAVEAVPTLRIFVEFLITHPGEVIIIDFEDYAPPEDIQRAFEESGLIDFVYKGPIDPWPTLGHMVQSGGRVLVLGETLVGDIPWYHLTWEGLMAETPYTFHTPEEFSCGPNRGTPHGELFLITHWIETTPTPRPSNADIVNQPDVVVRRVERCQRERRMFPNIIAVDFSGRGDVVEAARRLNGLPPAATATR